MYIELNCLVSVVSVVTSQTPYTISGVCKYYIGPIGDLSLLTAAAAATARIHSMH